MFGERQNLDAVFDAFYSLAGRTFTTWTRAQYLPAEGPANGLGFRLARKAVLSGSDPRESIVLTLEETDLAPSSQSTLDINIGRSAFSSVSSDIRLQIGGDFPNGVNDDVAMAALDGTQPKIFLIDGFFNDFTPLLRDFILEHERAHILYGDIYATPLEPLTTLQAREENADRAAISSLISTSPIGAAPRLSELMADAQKAIADSPNHPAPVQRLRELDQFAQADLDALVDESTEARDFLTVDASSKVESPGRLTYNATYTNNSPRPLACHVVADIASRLDFSKLPLSKLLATGQTLYFPETAPATARTINLPPHASGVLKGTIRFDRKLGNPQLVWPSAVASYVLPGSDDFNCNFGALIAEAPAGSRAFGNTVRGYVDATLAFAQLTGATWHLAVAVARTSDGITYLTSLNDANAPSMVPILLPGLDGTIGPVDEMRRYVGHVRKLPDSPLALIDVQGVTGTALAISTQQPEGHHYSIVRIGFLSANVTEDIKASLYSSYYAYRSDRAHTTPYANSRQSSGFMILDRNRLALVGIATPTQVLSGSAVVQILQSMGTTATVDDEDKAYGRDKILWLSKPRSTLFEELFPIFEKQLQDKVAHVGALTFTERSQTDTGNIMLACLRTPANGAISAEPGIFGTRFSVDATGAPLITDNVGFTFSVMDCDGDLVYSNTFAEIISYQPDVDRVRNPNRTAAYNRAFANATATATTTLDNLLSLPWFANLRDYGVPIGQEPRAFFQAIAVPNDYPVVYGAAKIGSAYRGGLRRYDRVISVNGVDLMGVKQDALDRLLAGQASYDLIVLDPSGAHKSVQIAKESLNWYRDNPSYAK